MSEHSTALWKAKFQRLPSSRMSLSHADKTPAIVIQPGWASSYIPTPTATKARFVPSLLGENYLWSSAPMGFNLNLVTEIGNILEKSDIFNHSLHVQIDSILDVGTCISFIICKE